MITTNPPYMLADHGLRNPDDSKAIAISYKDDVMAAMAALRKPVDELEVIMPKEVWPMPTYGDLVYEIDK